MNLGTLPFPGLTAELGQEVLRRALRRGGDWADLYVEDRRSLSLRLEDGKIEDAVSGADRGGSVRVLRGLSTAFGYADAVDELALESLAEELSLSQTGSPGAVATLAAVPNTPLESSQDSAVIGASDKAGLLRLVDRAARDLSPEVRQVIASYGESVQRVWMAESRGSFAADTRSRVTVSVIVMAARDGLIQTGKETLAYQGRFELPREAEVIAVGPGKLDDDGKRLPMDVKKGDRVLISKYGGTEIQIGGEEHLIIRQDDVLAVLS